MKIIKRGIYSIITVFLVFALFLGAADRARPEKISYISGQKEVDASTDVRGVSDAGTYSTQAKLFGILPIGNVDVSVYPELSLIPGGDVFGVKFFTKGVIVVGTSVIETEDGNADPPREAGIRAGDIIERIGGENVDSVEKMASIVEKSRGEKLDVYFSRAGKKYNTTITPRLALSDGKYKTGLWVRDSTAGIGTVTFYDPQSNTFAGLGHGICDVDTGVVMPLLKSSVVDISLYDTIKGRDGKPGELKGSFGAIKRGELLCNTESGVFGVLDSLPEKEALKIGLSSGVHEGEATIMSDVDGNGAKEYSIEIVRIYPLADTKNFLIKITDKELIEKTGGIVQGMSGSPIIQDGKLVGAVTHVLVGDPKKGYGIFIENMLQNMLSESGFTAA